MDDYYDLDAKLDMAFAEFNNKLIHGIDISEPELDDDYDDIVDIE